MTDTTVKYFASTMTGAPSLSGTAGALVGLLTACLVDGFGSVTLTSLEVESNVATATVSGGHGLEMIGDVGPVITIAGATPSGLNGEWRIASIVSSTEFTFATSGISDQTATGTITAKRAPLGWTKPYSDTNKAVYLPQLPYVQCYLRVDDTNASGARVRGYETMSAVDTGTGPFPTAAQVSDGLTMFKSMTADSTVRTWWLIGDGGIFYLGTGGRDNDIPHAQCFGDINSLKSGDAYSSFLCACATTWPNSIADQYLFGSLGAYNATQVGKYLARDYTQLGSSTAAGMMGDNTISAYLGFRGLPYPHPPDNGLLFSPVAVVENSIIRSRALPGLYQPLHTTPLAPYLTLDSIPDLPGRTLIGLPLGLYYNSAGQALFDLTGPWR